MLIPLAHQISSRLHGLRADKGPARGRRRPLRWLRQRCLTISGVLLVVVEWRIDAQRFFPNALLMNRKVRQISPQLREDDADEIRTVSSFAERPNIVLLGDPGAGKSHTFRQLAQASRGRLVTARAFLVTPAAQVDDVLFIDGLDERRAGRGDRDTVDALVEKLFAVAPKKVRISCRAADWLGESDLAALRPFFEANGGEPIVLLLERLSPDEQRMVLAEQGLSNDDVSNFVGEAQSRGLSEFLENPQNLLLLLKVVVSGQWPKTRRDLFEMATTVLLQESNAEHSRAGGGALSVAELRSAAGGILAARLISDVEAISLSDREGTAAIPSYRSFDIVERERLQAALGRRVFAAGTADETVDYTHRTTAEYLAAAWLAAQVRSGLPFGRVQALTGIDGSGARVARPACVARRAFSRICRFTYRRGPLRRSNLRRRRGLDALILRKTGTGARAFVRNRSVVSVGQLASLFGRQPFARRHDGRISSRAAIPDIGFRRTLHCRRGHGPGYAPARHER